MSEINVGDILEWFAGCALIAAAWTGAGMPVALVAAGVILGYFAQCYAKPLSAIRGLKLLSFRLRSMRAARAEGKKP